MQTAVFSLWSFGDISRLSITLRCNHVLRDTNIKGHIWELTWQSLTKPLGICPSTQQPPQHSESTAKRLLRGQPPCLLTLPLCAFRAQWWEKLCSSFSCRYSLGKALKKNKTGSPWVSEADSSIVLASLGFGGSLLLFFTSRTLKFSFRVTLVQLDFPFTKSYKFFKKYMLRYTPLDRLLFLFANETVLFQTSLRTLVLTLMWSHQATGWKQELSLLPAEWERHND